MSDHKTAEKDKPAEDKKADTAVGKAQPKPQTDAEKKAAAAKRAKEMEGKHPKNIHLPEEVLIKRPEAEEAEISEHGPEVHGDQSLMIIDNRNNKPIKVSLIEGTGLTKEQDGRLIFIESNVIHDLMSVEVAKSHFAVKKDGTVIYGQQGFDDVPHNAEFDMIDIVKLIEHNHGKKVKSDSDD